MYIMLRSSCSKQRQTNGNKAHEEADETGQDRADGDIKTGVYRDPGEGKKGQIQ